MVLPATPMSQVPLGGGHKSRSQGGFVVNRIAYTGAQGSSSLSNIRGASTSYLGAQSSSSPTSTRGASTSYLGAQRSGSVTNTRGASTARNPSNRPAAATACVSPRSPWNSSSRAPSPQQLAVVFPTRGGSPTATSPGAVPLRLVHRAQNCVSKTGPHTRGSPADVKKLSLTRKIRLMDLPFEMLQEVMDHIPSFAGRKLMCFVNRRTSRLEWRQSPPLWFREDYSGINLKDLGATTIVATMLQPRTIVLGELSLASNDIGNDGAISLGKFLSSPESLIRRLSLRDNRIGDLGASALAVGLRTNTKLEELDLWGNLLSESAKLHILDPAPRCEVYVELDGHLRRRGLRTLVDVTVREMMLEWASHMHSCVSAILSRKPSADPQQKLFKIFGCVDLYLRHLADNPRSAPDVLFAGCACTLVAASLRDMDELEEEQLAHWLSVSTNDAYSAQDISDFASKLRDNVGLANLWQPSAYIFLRRYLRKTGWSEESFSMANYVLELAAMDAMSLDFGVEAVAAAATIISYQYFNNVRSNPRINWRAKLLRICGCNVEKTLAPCTAALASLHANSYGSSRYCIMKYEDVRLFSVAKITPHPPQDASYYAAYLRQ